MPASPTSQDHARLDNPVYAALTGPHARFAQRSGRALRYDPDIAPFLAFPSEPSSADWQDALALVPPGAAAATLHRDGSPLPDSLRVSHSFELVQMIGERVRGADEPQAITLTAADVPEMIELVRVTEPGPFFERTIELGRYVGLRRDRTLVAMAGERLRFDGWTEISAVCTTPAYQGQGLATRLVSELVAGIQARGERVFLHVLTSNTNAIRLYEMLGFRVRDRQARKISVVTRSDPSL